MMNIQNPNYFRERNGSQVEDQNVNEVGVCKYHVNW